MTRSKAGPISSPSTRCSSLKARTAKSKRRPWNPNRSKIADLLKALAAVCFQPETVQQPTWIDRPDAPAGVIVACANGLLHVDSRTLLPHDPGFFNLDRRALHLRTRGGRAEALDAIPRRTMARRRRVDPALQEFFGYVISGRLDLHKIMLMVGPTRGGKGVIARILGRPGRTRQRRRDRPVSSLGNDFGSQPLIGKPLAIISDRASMDTHVPPPRTAAGDLGRGHDHRQHKAPHRNGTASCPAAS